jgi:uncharacterized protein (TIGR02001 family)
MNKNIVVLAAIALGAISANAEDAVTTAPAAAPAAPAAATEAPASSLSITSSLGYESTYMFRGIQLADAVFSPAVNVSYGNFYAGLWMAVAEDSADPYPTEADFSVGYNTAIGYGLKLDVGATRYDYDRILANIASGKGGNSFEPYVGVTADVLLSPSFYVYYDTELDNYTMEAKIGHSFETGIKNLTVNTGIAGGYVDNTSSARFTDTLGHQISTDYWYSNAKTDLVYAINDKTSVSIGARYSLADYDAVYGTLHDPNSKHDKIWFGAAFSTGF